MKKLFFCIIIIPVFLIHGIGQDFSIDTKVDTNHILIGDQVNLSYHIKHRKGLKIIPPVFEQILTDGIEVIGEPVQTEQEISNDRLEKKISYLITSFDTGMYYLPPLPFLVESEFYSDTVYSNATYLEVLGVELDTTNTVRDIKDIEKAPITFSDILPYILLVIILALVGVIIFFLISRVSGKDESVLKRIKPEEPPYYVALRELDKLKAEKVWQQKRTKEYYSRLTLIIRTYLEKRYIIPALEETTSEILVDFNRVSDADHEVIKILRELLNLADLVKFAKGEPLPEENIRLLDDAYLFLKKTKPVEEVLENSITTKN